MPPYRLDQQASLLIRTGAAGAAFSETTPLNRSSNAESQDHNLLVDELDGDYSPHEPAGYGSAGGTTQQPPNANEAGCFDSLGLQAYELADDHNPVTAFFEILTIRRLLLEHVAVVLSSGQIHSPDVQLNLVTPLWQAARERCGVWRPGDMRHQRSNYAQTLVDSLGNALQAIDARQPSPNKDEEDTQQQLPCKQRGPRGDRAQPTHNGGPLPSAAILYAALANRDYFLVLASAGQSQAELHQSRAEVAESLAIICAKALYKLGKQVLVSALCVKYTPVDIDALRVGIGLFQESLDQQHRQSVPASRRKRTYMRPREGDAATLLAMISGERHMSLLSEDQRVRVYRLGKAGDIALEHSGGTESPPPALSTAASSRCASGYATPIREISKEYLSGGTRILVERALEVAIRSEAKRFCAHKLVGEVVHLLWNGTVHWKGFSCVCLREKRVPESPECTISPSMAKISFVHRTDSAYDSSQEIVDSPQQQHLPFAQPPPCVGDRRSRHISEASSAAGWKRPIEAWLAQTLAPLRIPMFENILTMVHAFFFLWLYTLVSLERHERVTVQEVVLHTCALAYIADEIRQCRENGLSVYLKSVWNILDLSIYAVFIAFFALRVRCLWTGSPADLDEAYDVLALNASMLWPRLFSVLDQFEFFGTIIIQVRRIIAGTSLFFALLIVMTTGFFQTFYSLSKKHNDMAATSIWALMAKIFFGSALLGWDHAYLFGPYVGYIVMSMYIGVSMLILYNILIGVINQCMMEIRQNSAQEFCFAYTMRITEYVSANQTYPCVPPLNLLQMLVFWPLRKATRLLSHRSFALIRSTVLLFAYLPHLILYWLFKRLSRWWRSQSGMHRRALRAECGLSEKELAMIKIYKSDIDEYAFSGSVDGDSDSSEQHGQHDTRQIGGYNRQSTASALSKRLPNTAGLSQRSLAKSPTLIADGNDTSSRWTALMDTWKRYRKPYQTPLANSNIVPENNFTAESATVQARATEKRIAHLEAKMSDIDKKLDTIANLLQPVIKKDQ
ncbi:hypothetical protein H4217_007679 [Coemansia sp. RSA 1939]|nr:hypothetical protein H4217_007679 [Coemansia sp. RSA 1939]KAJ2595403.1 hypothetical protein EV177_008145 [Coemansia sp. RSA 1804]KAJ2667812.1 hypothetical protein GGH99_006566 [Coemansia sp. RSA 1285]